MVLISFMRSVLHSERLTIFNSTNAPSPCVIAHGDGAFVLLNNVNWENKKWGIVTTSGFQRRSYVTGRG